MGVVTVGLIVISGISKTIYYYWIRTPSASSINTATGFLRGNVRLLDIGHTAATFLTDEFGYKTAKGQLNLFKAVVFACGFFIPLLLTAFSVVGDNARYSQYCWHL